MTCIVRHDERRTRAERRIEASICRDSLADFIRCGWHVLEPTTPLVWNWHIDAICDHVQAALDDWLRKQSDDTYQQRLRNLLINVPPGTAKSRIVSVYTPAWMWLRCPSWRAIFLSANPRVALRDSVYCRDVITSEWYQEWFKPQWELRDDQNAKGLFNNTAGGFRQAIGITARIIGARADALFVDDPHDAEEVHSKTLREAVTERWKSAISNRVNDLRTSVRIGIMQRLHDEDWSGVVLKETGWEHLCIPQEFEPGRPDTCVGWRDPRTAEGELMFPERFPAEVLDAEKKRLGSFGYAGQHQQRPVPAEGGIFKQKWIRRWRPTTAECPECQGRCQHGPDRPCGYCGGDGVVAAYLLDRADGAPKRVFAADCRRFGVMDLAFSQKSSADYTVVQAWAVSPDMDLILLDTLRDRIEGPDLVPSLDKMITAHRLAYVGIEDVQGQTLVIQEARRRGLTVKSLYPDRDKITRAIPAGIRMEAQQVFFPMAAKWLADFENELLTFPNGSHDDMVDCLAYAALEVSKRGGSGVETTDRRNEREAREAATRASKDRERHNNPFHPSWSWTRTR